MSTTAWNFYNHFSSKEDVLLAITRIETQELSEFETMLATGQTPAKALEQFVWAYLDYAGRIENALMSLEILSVAVRTPSIADGFADNRQKLIRALSEVLKAGYRQGEFQPMVDFGATTLVLLDQIEGLALRSVLAQSPPSQAEKQVLWQIISRAILVRTERCD